MQTSIKISREAFAALFQPQPNQLDPQACHDFGGGGTMYEPFGAQLEYVQNNDAQSIWTICYGGANGGRDDYIVSGYHHEDRIGHIITKHLVPDDVQITIDLPNDDNLHGMADDFTDRVLEVLNCTEFASSHQRLDLEYHLYQMMGEAYGIMAATNEDGTLAHMSALREHMASLEKTFVRIETEYHEFKKEMEADNA